MISMSPRSTPGTSSDRINPSAVSKMSIRGAHAGPAGAASRLRRSPCIICSMRLGRSRLSCETPLRMRTIMRPSRASAGGGQGLHLPRQARLVPGGGVAVDDALAQRAVDDRQGDPESLARRRGVPAREKLADLLDLGAQAAAARPVDGVASQALAAVLEGRLGALHDLILLLGLTDP